MSLRINKALIEQVLKNVDREQLRPLLEQLDEEGLQAVARLLKPFIQDEALLQQLIQGLAADRKGPGGGGAPGGSRPAGRGPGGPKGS